MKKTYRFFTIGLLFWTAQIFAGEKPATSSNLLWDSFRESTSYFNKINDYTCSIKHTFTTEPEKKAVTTSFEISYAKPRQYYLAFKDNDGAAQEFIFVESATHRQFVFPKHYKISAEGAFIYYKNFDAAISIPANSLDLLYSYIIPLCDSKKDQLQWTFKDTEIINDQEASTFTITFNNPVNIACKPISFGKNSVKSIEIALLKNNSLPVRISFTDDTGAVDTLVYENMRINSGINELFFETKIAEKLREKEVAMENILRVDSSRLEDQQYLQQFTMTLAKIALEKYSKIFDYSAQFTRRENINGTLQNLETFSVKFRKPFDLYMKWLDGQNKGWELIYASGKYHNKVVVHVSGLANIFMPTLELDPSGTIAMMNNRHSILEFGLGFVIDNYYRDVNTSIKRNELKLTYHGEDTVDDRPCWVIEAIVPPMNNEYYCYRSIVYFDKEYLLPTKMLFYGWNTSSKKEELIEEYTYYKLTFNNGFSDLDFDRKNKEYKF